MGCLQFPDDDYFCTLFFCVLPGSYKRENWELSLHLFPFATTVNPKKLTRYIIKMRQPFVVFYSLPFIHGKKNMKNRIKNQ